MGKIFSIMTDQNQSKRKKPNRGDLYKKNKDINLPKEDIKVEKGQDTFLPALKKVLKKK
jgi:hypothetical protein